ncbi:MAG TPA: DUF6677 family protein, partial [Candidatus Acidoferrum sp.]|nr:DUF6677 family protein [Candidatus Acidoferrum sp.]
MSETTNGDGVNGIVSSAGSADAAGVSRDVGSGRRRAGKRQRVALAIAVAGWLVPGLGHALLKMWGRAAACFLAVALLVFLGAGMRGNVFASTGNDAFDALGYAADLGSGCFYFAARALEPDGADVSHANGDYGTRF